MSSKVRPPNKSLVARREKVAPIIAEQRERWLSIPPARRTIELRRQVVNKLYNQGKGLKNSEIAEVLGCTPETVRQALKGWSPVTGQERDLLAVIRQVDGGEPGGPFAQEVFRQVQAVLEGREAGNGQGRQRQAREGQGKAQGSHAGKAGALNGTG